MQAKKKLKLFSYVGGLSIYLFLAGLFAAFTYFDQKKSHYKTIYTRLEAGVQAGVQLLPMQLHDEAVAKKPLSFEREAQIAMQLGDLAQSLGLAYIYSMILVQEGEINFVLSSPEPHEMASRKFQLSQYQEPYTEAPPDLYPVWQTLDSTMISYKDRWGEFASLFMPFETPEGHTVVVGADVDIAEINQALRISFLKTLGFLSIIGLITLPLILVLEGARRRELRLIIRSLNRDELTGLGNRHRLLGDLTNQAHPQLILLNIIRFRDVSSGYGVAVGDMVLRSFGKYLKAYKHPELNPLSCYRMNGDEFALMVDQAQLPADQEALFSHFVRYVSEFCYKVNEEQIIKLQIRCGVVLNQHVDVLTLADMTLMAAREQGRSLIQYQPSVEVLNRFHLDRAHLASLRNALKNNRLVPYFQAIFYRESNRVSHYEALARILDEDGETILGPNEFIPIAHRYQLYYQITRSMVQQTLVLMKNNQVKVSFNLSIQDIEHPATSKYIINAIEQSGMGKRISFELLENEAINDLSLIRNFFIKIKTLGCRVGIDDLGKEYSNFDRLTELPIDFVKLDGVVMRFIVNDESTFDVVKDIVNLARKKNIATVAEYVHSAEILDKAVALGVDLIQGFHLAEPQAGFFAQDVLSESDNKLKHFG